MNSIKSKSVKSKRKSLHVKNSPIVLFGGLGSFAVSLLTLNLFISGAPLTGKGNRGILNDFNDYGEGAFAVDHVIYLVFTAWLLALAGAFIFFFLKSTQRVSKQILSSASMPLVIISFLAVIVSSITALILLGYYYSNDYPTRNFREIGDAGSENISYLVFTLIPILSMFGSVLLFRVIRREILKAHNQKVKPLKDYLS